MSTEKNDKTEKAFIRRFHATGIAILLASIPVPRFQPTVTHDSTQSDIVDLTVPQRTYADTYDGETHDEQGILTGCSRSRGDTDPQPGRKRSSISSLPPLFFHLYLNANYNPATLLALHGSLTPTLNTKLFWPFAIISLAYNTTA
jgi:hypothetical protein